MTASTRRGVPDTSEFQEGNTLAYSGDFWIFRVCFGSSYLDPKFLHNAAIAKELHARGTLAGALLYQVPLCRSSDKAEYDFFWKAIGPTIPPWMAGVMLDYETWTGQPYAIHGNHSAEANRLAGRHAARMGSWNSVIAYANKGDFNEVIPQLDKRVRTILADYTNKIVMNGIPRQIGHQYTNGQTTPPSGYVNATVPFGHCDHNAFPAFVNGKALMANLRPPVAPNPPVTPKSPLPPVQPPVPRYYPTGISNKIVDPTGHHAVGVFSNGGVAVLQDGKVVRNL